ncbi:rho-related GTP-binding protein RhoN-like [Lycorma delicatula]|uniref:rho-related GTP-binding protein RhoN-like n=1 Tax=Lycorma delicatula TaxID=130591 RepID=UPI003F511F19
MAHAMPASKSRKKKNVTANVETNGESVLIDVDCKIVLVGDSKCGKTCLIQRFESDKFSEVYTPTGFEKYAMTYSVGDYRTNFSIWDTSGAVAYDSVRPLAYQDVRVFLLCFRVSDPVSLDNAVSKWYPEIRQHCDNTPVILCGCQSDLRNNIDIISNLAKNQLIPVTSEQAVAVSRQIGATTYVETSAKTSIKAVRDAFEVAALASVGKLNKNHVLQQRQKGFQSGAATRSKSKLDLKAELKDRAKSCAIM